MLTLASSGWKVSPHLCSSRSVWAEGGSVSGGAARHRAEWSQQVPERPWWVLPSHSGCLMFLSVLNCAAWLPGREISNISSRTLLNTLPRQDHITFTVMYTHLLCPDVNSHDINHQANPYTTVHTSRRGLSVLFVFHTILGVRLSLCRKMFVQSLTLKCCFHIILLKGESLSVLQNWNQ